MPWLQWLMLVTAAALWLPSMALAGELKVIAAGAVELLSLRQACQQGSCNNDQYWGELHGDLL